jgi:hypothetical protein
LTATAPLFSILPTTSERKKVEMHKLLKKPSPAMVVACLALFLASTGTSIAARHYLITSTKQIKPTVLKKLKGAKGSKGSKGSTGAIGATGATGPSDAWEARAAGYHTITSTSFDTVTVTVPAGSYDISGTSNLLNWDATNVGGMQCILYHGASLAVDKSNYLDDVWVVAPVDVGGTYGPGAATAAVHGSYTTTASTTISLNCSAYAGTNETSNNETLSAIEVGTLH